MDLSAEMDQCRVKQKKCQGQGKDHNAGDGSYGIAAAEAGSKKHEATNGLPIGAVEPKEVAVLVDDEHFDGEAQCERPFPLGHDGLSGADHDQDFRSAGSEQTVEASTALAASVFVDRVNRRFGGKTYWQARVAGGQVERRVFSEQAAKVGEHSFQQVP
jgi:hypothetical protein